MHQTAFTILIDSQEKKPYEFGSIAIPKSEHNALCRRESDAGLRPVYHVDTEVKSLGNFRGDYSVAGMEGIIHVERKSAEDAIGTFIAWGERRERFTKELEFFASIEHGYIVVESSMLELMKQVPPTTSRGSRENAAILHNQILAWTADYRGIRWLFADSRRMAELQVFFLLKRAWMKFSNSSKSYIEREDKDVQNDSYTGNPSHPGDRTASEHNDDFPF